MEMEPVSFYFFDFDDNIMFLGTRILVRNTETREVRELSTGDFANVHPLLGKAGKWEDWAMFDGSYGYFRDIPPDQLEPGEEQYFARDVREAIAAEGDTWQAPAWKLFAYACEEQRPVSIVTARGHSPETLKAGVRVLVEQGLIAREPHYHTIFPVGNDDIRREQLDDPDLEATTPRLKKRAIIQSVEKALEIYGQEPEHRFGMSDDDPENVSLIIRAMCECKKKHLDKRFFAINTHLNEHVKLEVFPIDYSVTERPGSTEPLA